MYVVAVDLEIDLAEAEAFMDLMLANAETSRTAEEGCIRFDVCTDPARPGKVFLYELYTDRAAFDAHLASEHFLAFDQAVAPLLRAKSIRTFAEVRP